MNYTLTVVKKRYETHDTVTLCFKQPGLKKIKYLAGQYLTLIFRINGRRYIRPYSFSSCPGLDNYLEVTVKRIANGIVSNHIHDMVKEGDSIEVMPPMGDFIFEPSSEVSSVFLWGVGSGITPLMSIAKSILNSPINVKVKLLYGNKDRSSTIFYHQIQELLHTYETRFAVVNFHTNLVVEDNNPTIIQGRIDHAKAQQLLAGHEGLESTVHYICGPIGLKESVTKSLLANGIDRNRILSEDFELIKDPKEFEDVHTQIIQLKFNQQEFNLEVIKGKTILEAALDSDIELPYSCQTGNCSTCKGKLVSGNVKTIGLNKVREDLAENEFLLCCTHPLSDGVYIEI